MIGGAGKQLEDSRTLCDYNMQIDFFLAMQWGQQGRGGGGGGRQGEQQPWIAGTTKVPPYWDPSMDVDGSGYPFNEWAQDVVLWSIACELDENQKVPPPSYDLEAKRDASAASWIMIPS